jgi:hypothetical protein
MVGQSIQIYPDLSVADFKILQSPSLLLVRPSYLPACFGLLRCYASLNLAIAAS